MRKMGLALALALLLTGCGAKTAEPAEYVKDGVSEALSDPYEIVFGVPQDAVQTTFGEADSIEVYEASNGDYMITTEVMEATTVEEAIESISGFPAEQLTVLKLQRFPMPEYHFAWSSSGEEGETVSRAALIAAEDYYYVMTMTERAGLGDAYKETSDYVFSTFGLTTYDLV